MENEKTRDELIAQNKQQQNMIDSLVESLTYYQTKLQESQQSHSKLMRKYDKYVKLR